MSFDLFAVELEVPVGLKPNLAGKFDPDKQKFPCYASPKIDGFRGLGTRVGLLSRTLKLLPNRFTQARFKTAHGLDGELVCGEPFAQNCMQATSSAVTTKAGQPDVKFYVFDRWDMPGVPYKQRLESLYAMVLPANVIRVPQTWIEDQEALDKFEEEQLALGYEGVMTRDPDGIYKNGRSTTNEGGLIKVKRFEDDEAEIIGYTELVHEDGTLGGVLGALQCVTRAGIPFGVGTGFDAAERADLWARRATLPGRFAKYKHFNKSGVKLKQRHGVYLGLRDPLDMLAGDE